MVKLYVEGGGDSESLRNYCREGFRGFLEKAGLRGQLPRIVACGGRAAAFDRFRTSSESGEACFLLLDSEDAVTAKSPWEHLAMRPGDGYSKPKSASDLQCHLMVMCMESWFLADKPALSEFFGQGFNENALPKNPNIETVSKQDIFAGLQRASAHCKVKAPYGKGEHSFRILLHIAPEKIRAASPWARRFLTALGV